MKMRKEDQKIVFLEKDDVEEGYYEIVMDLYEGGTKVRHEQAETIKTWFGGDVRKYLDRTVAPIPCNRYRGVRVYHSEHIYG